MTRPVQQAASAFKSVMHQQLVRLDVVREWPETQTHVTDRDKGSLKQILSTEIQRNPFLEALMVCDTNGRILAESRRHESREQTHLVRPQVSKSDIVGWSNFKENALFVMLPVHGPVSSTWLVAELNLFAIAQHLVKDISLSEGVLFLVGESMALLDGDPTLYETIPLGAWNNTSDATDDNDDNDATHYAVEHIGTGVRWDQPLSIVYAAKPSPRKLSVFLPIVFVSICSIVILLLLLRFLVKLTDDLFGLKDQNLMSVGDWVLRTALDEFADDEKEPNVMSEEEVEDKTRVPKEINKWFVELERELLRTDQEVQQAYEIERDLNLAKDFQCAYLERPYPIVPSYHTEGHLRLKFHHRYQPAMALGGDFFDIIKLGNDVAGIIVADVMGHGTRSALITASLRTLINDLSKHGRNARFFMSEMNKQYSALLKNIPDMLFVSAFYFVADTTSRIGTYSCAGHPAPFYISRSRHTVKYLEVPPPRSAALGLFPREQFSCGQCRLTDGDVFVFFTDGIYEAQNEADEEFGMERMDAVLREHMHDPLEDILDHVIQAVTAFTGDQPMADDMCLVGVEVTTQTAH